MKYEFYKTEKLKKILVRKEIISSLLTVYLINIKDLEINDWIS